jgi:hypothetical protein
MTDIFVTTHVTYHELFKQGNFYCFFEKIEGLEVSFTKEDEPFDTRIGAWHQYTIGNCSVKSLNKNDLIYILFKAIDWNSENEDCAFQLIPIAVESTAIDALKKAVANGPVNLGMYVAELRLNYDLRDFKWIGEAPLYPVI